MTINKKEFEALIFDFDGTLVDTEPNHYEAFVRALKGIGIDYVSYEDHLKIYTGTGSKFIFAKELEKHNKSPELLEDLIKCKGEFYKESIEQNAPKQVERAAEFLLKAKELGFRLGLASGGGLKDIKHVMEKAGIPDVFEIYVTQDDKYKPKPAPDGFLLAAKKLDADPSKCIGFEDALNGIKAIMAANIKPIGVTTYFEKEKFQDIKSDIDLIRTFEEIILES